MGLIPEDVPRNKSMRNNNASLHKANLSSKIDQNLSISPFAVNAISTKLIVTTPKFWRPYHLYFPVVGSINGDKKLRHPHYVHVGSLHRHRSLMNCYMLPYRSDYITNSN